jgi:hypothetical protein
VRPAEAPLEVGLRGAAAREARPASAWPEEIADPPRPGRSSASLAAYIAWLSGAAEVLSRRVEANGAELDRLASEWDHVVRNLERLRPEEIRSVAEAQARLREVMAADRALHEHVELQRRQVAAWAEALGGPLTDPELVGRLLDGAAAERARVTAEMFELTAEAIAGAVLDLEVVRREALREPERAAVGLFEAGRRLTGAAEGLRELARAADLRPRPDEPLPTALRRCAEALGPHVRAEVVWTGPQAVEPRAATAIPAVVEECLRHLATIPDTEVQVTVTVEPGGAAAVRVTTPGRGLLPVEDESWLVRSRARAALAGGSLSCGPTDGGTFVELNLG